MRYGIISGTIAGIVALCYWYWALIVNPDGVWGGNSLGNIMCYILLLLIFLSAFCISYALMNVIAFENIINYVISKKQPYKVVVIFAFLATVFLVKPFIKDAWIFPIWVTGVVIISGYILIYTSFRKESVDSKIYLLFILLGGILWGLAVATPNTLSPTSYSSSYNMHHTSAYIDSIYNVYKQIKFHGGITDQYGHYALFYYIPLKLFGFSTQTIAVICGILFGATYILSMYSFCKVVKSQTVRYLVLIIGILFSPAGGGIYWQTMPHRLFFPAVILYLSTLFREDEKNIWKKSIVIVIMMAAIIWNIESGVVCCLAWVVFRCNGYLQKHEISLNTCAHLFGMAVVIILVPVIGAYIIVNGYNIAVGGINAVIGVRGFIGMAGNSDYIQELETSLKWGNEVYLHKIGVFLLCFCWGILHNKVWGERENTYKANYIVVAATIGLGLMTYSMNRTAAGNNQVNLFFAICLGLILDGTVENVKRYGILCMKQYDICGFAKGIAGIYALAVLLGCGMQNINSYQKYVIGYETNAYNYESFREFAEEIAQVVPENTWAIGNGTSALYMELGWEKGTWGFGDVQASEISEHNSVLVGGLDHGYVPDDFVKQQEWTYCDISFAYYVKE